MNPTVLYIIVAGLAVLSLLLLGLVWVLYQKSGTPHPWVRPNRRMRSPRRALLLRELCEFEHELRGGLDALVERGDGELLVGGVGAVVGETKSHEDGVEPEL